MLGFEHWSKLHSLILTLAVMLAGWVLHRFVRGRIRAFLSGISERSVGVAFGLVFLAVLGIALLKIKVHPEMPANIVRASLTACVVIASMIGVIGSYLIFSKQERKRLALAPGLPASNNPQSPSTLRSGAHSGSQ